MLNEFLSATLFYLIFSLFALIGLPLILRLNKKVTFISYLISKPLGLVVFAYPLWILSFAKLIKFNNETVVITLFVLAILVSSIFTFTYLRGKEIKWKSILPKFLITELVSLFLFLGYLYLRGFSPAIEGTERFMDMSLYMSAGKTDYFPFLDSWSPLQTVNYYYYGFYLFALITKLSGTPYAFGYNFCLSLILTLTTLGSFAVVFKATKSYIFSLLGGSFVTFAGNLHYAKCLITNQGPELTNKCYYPKATRILDPSYTINEMPSYSFMLGDMHPHVMGVPFLLANLYLLLLFYKSKKPSLVLFICLAFGLATSAMINTWDLIALALIFALITLEKLFKEFQNWRDQELHSEVRDLSTKKLLKIFGLSAATVLCSLILFLPFYLKFKAPVEGIGFSPSFVNHPFNAGKDFQYPSSFDFLFGIWGIYVLLGLIALLVLYFIKIKSIKFSFAGYLFAVAVFLVLFTELFYFKDLFHVTNPPYFRANTVFKLGYIAWILFGVSIASLLAHLWKNFGKIKSTALGIFLDLVFIIVILAYCVCIFAFPYYAIEQVYNPTLPGNAHTRNFTLDGNAYINLRNPNDLAAIKWLNENQKERIVVVEAVGGAYTYFGRIGVNTGMMNPVNWPTHEWTWRFSYPPEYDSWKDILGKSVNTGYSPVALVIKDVEDIYNILDVEQTKLILKKYNVKYVYIGKLERETYKTMNESKFDKIGKLKFQSGDSKLYEVVY